MIIKEVVQSNTTQLYGLAEFLLSQFRDTAAQEKINTKTFLELAQDAVGMVLSIDQLRELVKKPPLNNVIQDMSDDGQVLYFKGADQEPNKEMDVGQAQEIVARSARRAAKKRNK